MEITKAVNIKQIIISALVVSICPVQGQKKQSGLIYILLWSYTSYQPWIYRSLELGQEAFTSRNCSFQNCFVTTNQSYFDSVLDYDVLILNAIHYAHFPSDFFPLPTNRSEHQLYILACFEPAGYNFLPDYISKLFNVTWTYKLNSDIVHPYFVVKNNMFEIIGPKLNMSWLDINDLPPANKSIIQKLKNKRIAALWVVSDCYAKDRLVFGLKLQKELQSKYRLQVDIFGQCGNVSACPMVGRERIGLLSNCYDKVQSDYYFYLAFENSKGEDYVSEKVLHGLNHLSVPVVYGGADYRRFLPDGIYLDAVKLGVENLAKEMNDIINNPPRYYNFFKWHGFYTFHDSADENYHYSVCQLCRFLNNEKRKRKGSVRVYDSIVDWWNVPTPETFPYLLAFRNFALHNETTTITRNSVEINEEPEVGNSFVSNVLNFLNGE